VLFQFFTEITYEDKLDKLPEVLFRINKEDAISILKICDTGGSNLK